MTAPTIELPPLATPVDQLWHVLLDLGEQLTVGWALVGGQMVLLHALEHGRVPPQISQDGDVVADVRTQPSAVHDVVAALGAAGFEPDIPSADGIAHRYSRPAEPRPVVVDVLGPEGLPADTQLLVTAPPNRTIEIPGGTQALARTETVTVVHERRVGHLPRPTPQQWPRHARDPDWLTEDLEVDRRGASGRSMSPRVGNAENCERNAC